jgi:hypothetical protein
MLTWLVNHRTISADYTVGFSSWKATTSVGFHIGDTYGIRATTSGGTQNSGYLFVHNTSETTMSNNRNTGKEYNYKNEFYETWTTNGSRSSRIFEHIRLVQTNGSEYDYDNGPEYGYETIRDTITGEVQTSVEDRYILTHSSYEVVIITTESVNTTIYRIPTATTIATVINTTTGHSSNPQNTTIPTFTNGVGYSHKETTGVRQGYTEGSSKDYYLSAGPPTSYIPGVNQLIADTACKMLDANALLIFNKNTGAEGAPISFFMKRLSNFILITTDTTLQNDGFWTANTYTYVNRSTTEIQMTSNKYVMPGYNYKYTYDYETGPVPYKQVFRHRIISRNILSADSSWLPATVDVPSGYKTENRKAEAYDQIREWQADGSTSTFFLVSEVVTQKNLTTFCKFVDAVWLDERGGEAANNYQANTIYDCTEVGGKTAKHTCGTFNPEISYLGVTESGRTTKASGGCSKWVNTGTKNLCSLYNYSPVSGRAYVYNKIAPVGIHNFWETDFQLSTNVYFGMKASLKVLNSNIYGTLAESNIYFEENTRYFINPMGNFGIKIFPESPFSTFNGGARIVSSRGWLPFSSCVGRTILPIETMTNSTNPAVSDNSNNWRPNSTVATIKFTGWFFTSGYYSYSNSIPLEVEAIISLVSNESSNKHLALNFENQGSSLYFGGSPQNTLSPETVWSNYQYVAIHQTVYLKNGNTETASSLAGEENPSSSAVEEFSKVYRITIEPASFRCKVTTGAPFMLEEPLWQHKDWQYYNPGW